MKRRTTVALDDDLLAALKRRAAEERTTLQDVVNDALRHAVAPKRAPSFTLRLRGWKAVEQPGVDIRDRDALLDLMNGR
jgi:Arc/MetJ family transcription regulator